MKAYCLDRSAQEALDQRFCKESGLPLLLLMEQAGQALFSFLQRQIPASTTKIALFLAGRGGNGGDAYVAARSVLARGEKALVLAPEGLPPADSPAAEMAAAYQRLAGQVATGPAALVALEALRAEDLRVIVDGLYGTAFRVERGFKAELRPLLAALAERAAAGCPLVAIDLPSGVDADWGRVAEGTLRADYTFTFVRPKRGLLLYPAAEYCGQLAVGDLSIPEAWLDDLDAQAPLAEWLCPEFLEAPLRPLTAHKGSCGRLAVWAGSARYAGAAVLATRSAYKSGCGYVHLWTDEGLRPTLLETVPELIFHDAAELATGLPESLLRADALLFGPGLAESPLLPTLLPELLQRYPGPLVMDADALNAMARQADWPTWTKARAAAGLGPLILTPHRGEFARLAPDLADLPPFAAAAALAERAQCYLIYKGPGSLVATPSGKIWINSSGNQALAKAGSGDVLAGLLGALLAQGLAVSEALKAAVYVHGAAAERLSAKASLLSPTASELPDCFGEIFLELAWPREN